ncbi:MMPL family transporter [Niallia nealsonii]|uniref:SSD domain-containing protein n=1 Tax=Niallia nealsonii TaxID=115979 RepID=A0A2N0Z1T9_9BACI|nr:MMPL family transporter [Niallia nealsonii]PKG23478.1 hypothetical protein CWS01_10800 [Niallia nealsonii]
MKKIISNYFTFVASAKGRWITIVSWICLVALLSIFLPQASEQKNEMAKNLSADAPSQEAAKIAEKEFPNEQGTPALITFYRKDGITEKDLANFQQLAAEISKNPVAHQQSIMPIHQLPTQALLKNISKDGTSFVFPVLFDKQTETAELETGIQELKKASKDIFSSDPFDTNLNKDDVLHARITGPVGISIDATALFSQGDLSLLFATVAIVLICLLVIYRSPILALIPLIGVAIAYGVISPILGALGKADWIVFDSQGISIMTVLLFGAGTDYCLFLIAKYRSLLTIESDSRIAMQKSLSRASGAIAMSGLTVVVSLFVLLLAKYGSIQRFAVPFSIAILIMMIASLTLVPALLSILGRISFYPFIPRTEEMQQKRNKKTKKTNKRFGNFIGTLVTKHPWKVTIVTLLFLSVFALYSTKIEYTYDTLSSFPKDMPSREGFTLIEEHFTAGELAPVQVIIQTDGEEINVKEELEQLAFVSTVSDSEPAKNDKNLQKYTVELNTNPYSNKAMEELPLLEKAVVKSLEDSGIQNSKEKVWIGGITAEQLDTKNITTDDAGIIIPVVISMIAVLLFIYLRSITATVYLIATVLLSYFSALGIGWAILHYFFHVDAIQGLIPLYAFVFIVALGEDYNIFMISSIWKKSKEVPLLQAIKEGVSESGSVITSAGIILAATFMVLTTLPIQILVHFGTITAIGVLLDTFVVRPFLVPSITAILGKKAFWPAKKQITLIEKQENS